MERLLGSIRELFIQIDDMGGIVFIAVAMAAIFFAGVSENLYLRVVSALIFVALVNSAHAPYDLMQWVYNDLTGRMTEPMFVGAFNPVSGMLLCLILRARYRNLPWNAASLGFASFGMTVLLSGMHDDFPGISEFGSGNMLIVLAIGALICAVMSQIRHFYLCCFVFMAYCLVMRIIVSHAAYGMSDSVIAQALVPDVIICGAILLAAILYERLILAVAATRP